ncbi:response regulator transcription factor [Demequina mangrovi]|uniref:Two-component system, OmpR family, response regulator BasR n=1 Tax=Demequina mangrovi TaxID=1043493 RepID=A0A1H7AS44_9MICO|nr:response regulator transcription factor [Demequina mangrovi]SEJ66687.1 two-component system, OmpR family, response regulator BasR [Demequina mangrovi]
MRVLVVEDHAVLAREVATGLRRDGLAVDVARDGEEALDKARVSAYDVVVLDRDLPRVHGDDVCRTLVAQEPAPRVLMLTAAGSLEDIVEGLGLGADDYLAKPFAMVELIARVRTLGRRGGAAPRPRVSIGGLEIRPDEHAVTRDGRPVALSPKEFGVLEVLAAQPGRVVSAETLLEKVWDEYADPLTNAVRVTMVTLRRKLGEPALIETIKGVGYVLRADGDA